MHAAALLPSSLVAPAPAARRSRAAAASALRPRAVAANGAPAAASGARRHPNSQWPTGVPPRMGEHVMPSGRVAPPSVSTTVKTGVPHLFQYHNEETPVSVEARFA
jgi:hypothetical protein